MLVLFAAIMTGANAQKERFKALFI